MPRIRSIKPSFFRSEDVSALPLRARLTWIGLWTHCDDAGRTKDNPRLIKGDIWPLDAVSLRDIEEDLQALADNGRIVRYEVDGKYYLEIVNWAQHQVISKPTPSRIPAPSQGRVLTSEEPPEDLETEPVQESSGNPPVGLQEDSGRAPVGKGKEGKGREGKGGEARTRAREAHAPDDPGPEPPPLDHEDLNPEEPPPSRCPKHLNATGEIPPCRPCGHAKETRRAWDAARVTTAAAAQSAAARQRAEANAVAIAACNHCDIRGRLPGGVLCAHDSASADRTQRGAAAARAALTAREPS